MVGGPTTVAVAYSGALDPELPTATDDTSDQLVAGLSGGALRASAHGILHVTAQRIGRGRSVVLHLINTSSVEPSDLLLSPCHVAVRTRHGTYNEPRGDVRVDVARPIG